MSLARIDTWLTTIGRVSLGAAATGSPLTWQVTLTGEHETFQAACTELEARLNALGLPGITWTVTAQANGCLIEAAGGLVDLQWYDEEHAGYYGFGLAAYVGVSSMASDDYCRGRISLMHEADVSFGDLLYYMQDGDHAGAVRSLYLGRQGTQRMDLLIDPDEAWHFARVLQRLKGGVPASISLDSGNVNAFAWTAAAWEGIRTLALRDGSQADNYTGWLGAGTAIFRRFSLDLVEAG